MGDEPSHAVRRRIAHCRYLGDLCEAAHPASGRPISDPPPALSARFAADLDKQQQWVGFMRRTEFAAEPAPFARVLDEIIRFALPPLTAAARAEDYVMHWQIQTGWGAIPNSAGAP